MGGPAWQAGAMTSLPPSRFTAFGLAAEAEVIAPGLHIVATPIGNLKDISFRALGTLAAAAAVIAEDTRVTKTLLAHYGITTPLVAYHEHNASRCGPASWRAWPRGRRWPWSRCGHAARFRSRLQAGGGRRGRGHRGDDGARPFGRAHRPGDFGAAFGPLLLRGLPAAQIGGPPFAAGRSRRRAGHAGLLRIGRGACRKCWPTPPRSSAAARPRWRAN